MKAQYLTIDALTGEVTLPARGLRALHDTTLVLHLAFKENGVFGPITSYTASTLRIGFKAPNDLQATTSLLPAGTWEEPAGGGAAARYKLSVEVDSQQLRTLLGSQSGVTLVAQIAWQISTDDNERKSQLFEITIQNSATNSEDGAPDPAEDDAWTWLKARLPEGAKINRVINESAKTITFGGLGTFVLLVATDTALNSSSDTTLFTFPVEANKQYKLDLSIAAYVKSGSRIRLWGIPPSGSTARGRWRTLVADGYAENARPPVFGELTSNHVIDATNAMTDGNLAAPNQSFVINVGSTAGNILVYARSTSASGDSILANSWGHLTQITV